MTTNCIQKPTTYLANIFTTGLVGWPGAVHVGKDFSAVIARALSLPGFAEDEDRGAVMVGFARNAVLGVAPAVIDAVKAGKIRHFFLVGGCDGAKPGRNYYTEFVEKARPTPWCSRWPAASSASSTRSSATSTASRVCSTWTTT